MRWPKMSMRNRKQKLDKLAELTEKQVRSSADAVSKSQEITRTVNTVGARSAQLADANNIAQILARSLGIPNPNTYKSKGRE